MRELRLKYILDLVSNVASRAKTDQQALVQAQEAVQSALRDTNGQLGVMERLLLRMARVGGQSANQQAAYLANLALKYQDVRRQAEGASRAMETVAKVGAGVTAGAMAADRMMRAPMDYSERLARMANNAYGDRDTNGRRAGKATLNAAITAATRVGGGTRDDAAGALDTLIASGAMPIQDAIKVLPTLMRGSTGSGATAEQLSAIALAAVRTFGISVDQIPDILNVANEGGKGGGFELRNMAKWLPSAMALGRNSGLSGMDGMRRLVASMQASVVTAGTPDEAGNNVVNLLGKINSSDTANDFKKHLNVDLPSELAAAREKGVNSLDAFVGLVDRVAQRDPEYMALKKRLDQAQSQGERSDTLASMTDVLQGKAVGKVVQDRQALLALVAEMNNRSKVQEVMQATAAGGDSLGRDFALISEEANFKRQQALNQGAEAVSAAFDKVTPAVNALFDGATKLGQEFPGLAANITLAAGALTVFTAALGASGLISLLTGAAGKAGGVPGVAGTILAGTATRALPWLAGGTAVAGVGYALWDWYKATHHEGVKLTPEAQSRIDAMPKTFGTMANNRPLLWGDTGPSGFDLSRDYLSLTDPRNIDLGKPGARPPSSLSVGEGTLEVNVRVSDERATATSSVVRQPSLVKLDPGNTNPGWLPPPR